MSDDRTGEYEAASKRLIRELRADIRDAEGTIKSLLRRQSELQGRLETTRRSANMTRIGLAASEAGVKAPAEWIAKDLEGTLGEGEVIDVDRVRAWAEDNGLAPEEATDAASAPPARIPGEGMSPLSDLASRPLGSTTGEVSDDERKTAEGKLANAAELAQRGYRRHRNDDIDLTPGKFDYSEAQQPPERQVPPPREHRGDA